MDPFTQGTLGAALPQAVRHKPSIAAAGALGFLSGMAADLDVLIRSPTDPLLFLEYHRQFTHALVFIPLGGLITALVLHWVLGRRWQLGLVQTAVICTLGYATHALLDTATSYGTMLMWPFSDHRFAWRIVSVIDPLFTLPLAGLVTAALIKRSPAYARAGLIWAGLYLSVGALQHHAALKMGEDIAAARGHAPTRLQVKPSFANILVWKTLYEADGRYHVDAVRVRLAPRVFEGQSVPKLDLARDFAWLDPQSQQARDIERFRHFSNDFIARDPAEPDVIIDVRYSLIPNQIAALWSIKLNKTAPPTTHAHFRTHRQNARKRAGELWQMMAGGGG